MWERIKFMASDMWDFLRPLIRIFLSEFGPILAEAAMSAVTITAQNMLNKSGDEKKENAYNLIVRNLGQQGIAIGSQVTKSMINAAIEAAVQKLA